jgi:hypothetical protein
MQLFADAVTTLSGTTSAIEVGIILGASLIFVGIAEGTFILVAFVLKG